MRNGLLIYRSYNNYFNIGDYIQSLAALQFLKNPLTYINREELDEWDDEQLRVIMNGWFLHEKEHFPPSNKIDPVFISFHLNSVAYDILKKIKIVKYLRKYAPIGCRDKKTRNILLSHGIEAYFSGCLTLTLGYKKKYKNVSNNHIFFVDPFYLYNHNIKSRISYLFEIVGNFSTILTIARKTNKSSLIKRLLSSAAFYKSYKKIFKKDVLINAHYIQHMVDDSYFKNEDEKFKYAAELLDKYANAKFVVTSRIHCALPCLAFETPVLYTEKFSDIETSTCRLDGLIELLNTIKISPDQITCEILKKGETIGYDFTFKNKGNYLELRNNLLKKIKNYFL